MREEIRSCIDVISPVALREVRRLESLPHLNNEDRRMVMAVMPIVTQWPNGSVLKVRFMGGTNAEQDTVKQIGKEWERHANLKFEFNNAPNAEIRIAFVQDGTSWSYIGTDCLNIPRNAATMNFGWPLEEATILHEFGHAIGLGHEHQNPEGGLQWNEANVIRDLSGPPNFWDEATIRHNVLSKYRSDQIKGTEFDEESIMLYSFPKSWTLDGFQAARNAILSAIDKDYIGSTKGYPFPSTPADSGTDLPVIDTAGIPGEISRPGEEDLFKCTIKKGGKYLIETQGSTDVIMKLFGPNSRTALIAEDDDSGSGANAQIIRNLAAGEYFVQIRHFNRTTGTGPYTIRALKQA